VSKRRPPPAAAFRGTAGARAAGTAICASLNRARKTTPHHMSKRPSPHVIDQPLCSRGYGYDTGSVHVINSSMRSNRGRMVRRILDTSRWKRSERNQSISRSDPHPPLSLGQHLRCALEAMHSRRHERLRQHAAGSLSRTRTRSRLLTRPLHSPPLVHTDAGRLQPHKRSHTAARTGSSIPVPSLSVACGAPAA